VKIELKPLQLGGVADKIRERIIRNIKNIGKWNKTGHLLQSLKTQVDSSGKAAVTVANDRLNTDDLAQLFFDEIVPHDLDNDALEALGEAVKQALVTEEDK